MLPLKMVEDHAMTPAQHVIGSVVELMILLGMMSLVQLVARRRSYPDLAARAPDRGVSARETTWLWVYAAMVLGFGQWLRVTAVRRRHWNAFEWLHQRSDACAIACGGMDLGNL